MTVVYGMWGRRNGGSPASRAATLSARSRSARPHAPLLAKDTRHRARSWIFRIQPRRGPSLTDISYVPDFVKISANSVFASYARVMCRKLEQLPELCNTKKQPRYASQQMNTRQICCPAQLFALPWVIASLWPRNLQRQNKSFPFFFLSF